MRSLKSLHESRVHGPQNFRSPVQNDFCNKIGPQRRKMMSAPMSAIGGRSGTVTRGTNPTFMTRSGRRRYAAIRISMSLRGRCPGGACRESQVGANGASSVFRFPPHQVRKKATEAGEHHWQGTRCLLQPPHPRGGRPSRKGYTIRTRTKARF
jgi:hypothetical protein